MELNLIEFLLLAVAGWVNCDQRAVRARAIRRKVLGRIETVVDLRRSDSIRPKPAADAILNVLAS